MKIKAKPIEWESSPLGSRYEEFGDHGFHVEERPEEAPEDRYWAAWGEGDLESFSSLEEAKAWCQEQIDSFIRTYAVVDQPPATT